jgi:hypothetical protein
LENLIALTWGNLFDRVRKICCITTSETSARSEHKQHKTSRNSDADCEQFKVNFFHCSILADFLQTSRALAIGHMAPGGKPISGLGLMAHE